MKRKGIPQLLIPKELSPDAVRSTKLITSKPLGIKKNVVPTQLEVVNLSIDFSPWSGEKKESSSATNSKGTQFIHGTLDQVDRVEARRGEEPPAYALSSYIPFDLSRRDKELGLSSPLRSEKSIDMANASESIGHRSLLRKQRDSSENIKLRYSEQGKLWASKSNLITSTNVDIFYSIFMFSRWSTPIKITYWMWNRRLHTSNRWSNSLKTGVECTLLTTSLLSHRVFSSPILLTKPQKKTLLKKRSVNISYNKKMNNIFTNNFFIYFDKLDIKKKDIYWPIFISFFPIALQRRVIKLFLLNQNWKKIRYSQIENFLAMNKKCPPTLH